LCNWKKNTVRQDIEETGGVEVIGEERGREKKRLDVQRKGVGHWGKYLRERLKTTGKTGL
jgi:hypothetical protein